MRRVIPGGFAGGDLRGSIGSNWDQRVLRTRGSAERRKRARGASGFFYETRFQRDRDAIDFAVDLVIPIHQADVFGPRALFERT